MNGNNVTSGFMLEGKKSTLNNMRRHKACGYKSNFGLLLLINLVKNIFMIEPYILS